MSHREMYKNGYAMGYDYVAYEGGRVSECVSELRQRGFNPRTPYAVGFMGGAKDAAGQQRKKYT